MQTVPFGQIIQQFVLLADCRRHFIDHINILGMTNQRVCQNPCDRPANNQTRPAAE